MMARATLPCQLLGKDQSGCVVCLFPGHGFVCVAILASVHTIINFCMQVRNGVFVRVRMCIRYTDQMYIYVN